MDVGVEIPAYFICPISLLIMKDPVTAVTGITYDRDSIEKWLLDGDNTFCPVTNLPLPRDSDLTPNHTLRRLIQAWCTANAAYGVDRIPTPKTPLSKVYAVNLVRDLSRPRLRLKTLQKLELLAMEKETNRKSMVEAGVVKELLCCIIGCHKRDEKIGLEETLYVLYLVRGFSSETTNQFIAENDNLLDAILWVLERVQNHGAMKSHALCVMKMVVGKANPGALERLLTPEIFKKIVNFLRENNTITQQGLHAALQIMLEICPKNRVRMVESGAVFELIELELNLSPPDKKTTELVLGVLFHLCSCADGRAQLLSHAAGIAAVTRKILKVSPTADDRAVLILSLISRFSATSGVLQEMLRVGTVAKLCVVLQADCASYLKDKAKEILRTHFDVWKNSPCVEVATLTRYAR